MEVWLGTAWHSPSRSGSSRRVAWKGALSLLSLHRKEVSPEVVLGWYSNSYFLFIKRQPYKSDWYNWMYQKRWTNGCFNHEIKMMTFMLNGDKKRCHPCWMEINMMRFMMSGDQKADIHVEGRSVCIGLIIPIGFSTLVIGWVPLAFVAGEINDAVIVKENKLSVSITVKRGRLLHATRWMESSSLAPRKNVQ